MEPWQVSYRMIRDRSWINRRVERLSVLGEDSARRQISLDVCLPEDVEGPIAVPIATMGKSYGILGELDLRDEGGASIPLLTRGQAEELFRPMLEAAAREVLDGQLPRVEEKLWQALLTGLLDGDAGQAERGLELLDHCRDEEEGEIARLADDQGFRELAEALARHYFLFVPLDPADGRRRIIKYGFTRALTIDEPQAPKLVAWAQRRRTTLGWRPMPLRIELPAGVEASPAPYYLTVSVPEGLALTPLTPAASSRSWFDQHHLIVRGYQKLFSQLPAQQLAEGKAIARLEKAEGTVETGVRLGQNKLLGGPLGLGLLVAIAILGLIAALSPAAGLLASGGHLELGSAVGLLFAIPGLFAGYLAVSHENSLMSHLLAGVRAAMAFTALIAGSAAMTLILDPPWIGPLWMTVIVAQSAVVFALLVSYLRGRHMQWVSSPAATAPPPERLHFSDGRSSSSLAWRIDTPETDIEWAHASNL